VNKVIPTVGRLLIRRDAQPEPSKIIHTLDRHRERAMSGVVVAAGANTTIEAGTRVVMTRYQGGGLRIDNVEHLLIEEDQIGGIIASEETMITESRPQGV